ncbi:hypothetical protein MYAM1_003711 [Malassezia yamatoensis]|uniref:Transcription factor domain-containing protein n=1 Tax=Malassezia yamatoensis TaxID=253288 RepID=A0AAJ5YV56_9BASI|nr:hypothetical protein MYAM1_003711 [Malassezia yamatoensis]
MTRQHEGIRRAIEWLNECPWANNQGDTRLVALVNMWEILHDAIDEIGSDSRTPLDELGLAYHARFQAKIEVWHNTWSLEFSNPNTYERCELDRQRLYAELFLHSLAFRADQGTLPILFPAQVTYQLAGKSSSVFQHVCFQADQRRIIAENAIRSSHAILELLANSKAPVSKLVGQTSYSHTMTTFAIVLLMKALKQFGDQAEQCHLRGSDLRSVLRSIDPAFQALVAGAECVADENILVSISTATKQSIDQLYNTIPSERQDLRSRQTHGYDNASVFNTHHSSRSSPFMASYPAPDLNTHKGQSLPSFPIHSSAQDQQMQGQRSQATPLDGLNRESPFLSLGSLDGFDLLSGQIPLSGIGLFQDTALDTDFDISGATSMADTHPM